MRTQTEIDLIKSRIETPYEICDFLHDSDIEYLIKLFRSTPETQKIYKNTGPVTLNLNSFSQDVIIQKIFSKIQSAIGPYDITSAFFFETDYPHVIHNDDIVQLPNSIYKAITIPLEITSDEDVTEYPKLCFFDQFYFHGPSKFFKGENVENIKTYYNKSINEYSGVEYVLDYYSICYKTYNDLFTHMKYEWLHGLSINSVLQWKPKNALVFDSTRLHCSSDFRKNNIKRKLAISIFTAVSDEIDSFKFLTF